MSNWTSATIKKLISDEIIEQPIDGNHGETHPKGSDFVESGIPFIMASDIVNGNINFNECKFISESQAKRLRKGFSYEGDVLLSHKATIGRTALVPKLNCNYIMLTPQVTYYRIKDEKKLNNKFLKYYFDVQPFQDQIKLWAGAGSTRAYIGITQQQNLQISYPDVTTQQKIAKVLSDLDAKIELNNKINAELEAMAKTLYDYWFVQFDFPYVTSSGVEKPYKSSGGKMVWNEELKREIPEGWEVGTLDSIGNIIGGSTPSKAIEENFSNGEGTPWITPKDLSNNKGKKFITRGEYDVTERGLKEASLKVMPVGTVLLSSRAPIGYLAIARKDVTTNQGFKSFVPKSYFSSEYIYFTIQHCIPEIEANSSGSTFKEVSSSTLKTIKNVLPSKEVLTSFYKIVNPIFRKIDCIELENEELASLRDWLLPMLMNGQVTVGNTNESIEEKKKNLKELTDKFIEYPDQEEKLGMVAEEGEEYGK